MGAQRTRRNNTNELCGEAGAGTGMPPMTQGKAEQDRSEQRGDHHQDHDRGKQTVINDADAFADAGEDQADFTAGHHADADGPAVHGRGAAKAAHKLAENGDDGEG